MLKQLARDIVEFGNKNFQSPGQHPGEIIPLTAWLLEQNISNIFELGCYLRCNASVMCSVASGKKVFLDNTYAPDADEKLKSMFPNVHVLVADSHLQSSVKWVEGVLQGEQFDFMFIDGDHTYEGVRQDKEMYWHLLKPGGWMAFHDIVESPSHHAMDCFVDLFWKDIKDHYETMEFNAHSDWAGIGLCQKKL